MKYCIAIAALDLVPVFGFHWLTGLAWGEGSAAAADASMLELCFVSVFLPVYLLAINYLIAKKYSAVNVYFIINMLVIAGCILLASHLHFLNWAGSGGNYQHPDDSIVHDLKLERILGLGLCVPGGIIILFLHRKKRKTPLA